MSSLRDLETRDRIIEAARALLTTSAGITSFSIEAVARQANVPIVAFSSDAQIAGKGVYLMSFLAEEEVNRIVGFAASQGKKRFAALIPDNAYGNVVEPVFRRAVERAGGTVATASDTFRCDVGISGQRRVGWEGDRLAQRLEAHRRIQLPLLERDHEVAAAWVGRGLWIRLGRVAGTGRRLARQPIGHPAQHRGR